MAEIMTRHQRYSFRHVESWGQRQIIGPFHTLWHQTPSPSTSCYDAPLIASDITLFAPSVHSWWVLTFKNVFYVGILDCLPQNRTIVIAKKYQNALLQELKCPADSIPTAARCLLLFNARLCAC